MDIRYDRFNLVAVRSGFRDRKLVACTRLVFDSQLSANEKTSLIAGITTEFIQEHHLEDSEVAVSLPRELFIVRDIRLPLSVKENLRTTLGYQMQQYVPLPLADIYFDFLTIEEDSTENSLRIILIVIRKKDMAAYLDLERTIGKQLSGVEMAASAISGYLAERFKEQFPEKPFGLIRSGHDDSEVWAYHRGRLAFAKKMTIEENGDPEKRNALLVGKLSDAATSYAEFHPDTRWLYYSENHAKSLLDAIADKTKLTLEALDDRETGLPSTDFLPAYALALNYLDNKSVPINLLPPNLRKKPNRTAYYVVFALGLLVIITAFSWGGSVWLKQRMATRQLEETIQRLQQEVIQVDKLIEKNNEMERQITLLSTLYQNRSSVLAILEELSQKIPLTVWIEEFNFTKGSVQISGYADSATDLVQIIETSPLFDNVVFLSAITRTKDGKEKFQIGMGIQNK